MMNSRKITEMMREHLTERTVFVFGKPLVAEMSTYPSNVLPRLQFRPLADRHIELAEHIVFPPEIRYNFRMRNHEKSWKPMRRRERKARLVQNLAELYHEDTIPIRLRSVEDLYNHFDPASEQERELSAEIEAYILKEMEYKPPKSRIAVTFIADDVSLYDIELMRSAFANHFRRRAEEQVIRNRKSANRWLCKFLAAVGVLASLLFAAHFFRTHSDAHPFYIVLSESLGIIGWVAIWEPATYFLYGRGEERRTLFDFIRLAHATVTIRKR